MKKLKSKKFIATYVILLLCVVLAVSVWWSENPTRKTNIKNSKQSELLFQPVESDQMSYIKIESQNKSVEIVKENDVWKLKNDGDFPADSDLMKSILSSINSFSRGEIISKNSENYPNFELSEDKALRLEMGTDAANLSVQLYIGKKGPSINSTYVRSPHNENVLLVKKNLASLFNNSTFDFREKNIWTLNFDEIKSIAIKSKTEKKILLKNDQGLWTIEGLENSDPNKLESFISILSKVEAQSFSLDDNHKFEPGTEDIKLFVETVSGDFYTLYIKELDEKYYGFKEGNQDTIYVISSFFANQLIQDSGNFQVTKLEENN